MPILSVISRTEGARNTVIACIIICIPLLWTYLHGEKVVQRYIYRQARNTYFCGHSLKKIAQQRLFGNLERFLDVDLSGIDAVLMMMLLHDNETTRLVRCRFNDGAGEYWHSWVEFRYLGSWYVLDPSWYESLELKRKDFDLNGQVGKAVIYGHDRFWSFPISRQIYRKLHHPQTSYLFYELYGIASEGYFKDAPAFSEQHGRVFKPIWFGRNQIVSRGVVDFMIQDRDYREPPHEITISAIREETHDYYRNHPEEEDEYDP